MGSYLKEAGETEFKICLVLGYLAKCYKKLDLKYFYITPISKFTQTVLSSVLCDSPSLLILIRLVKLILLLLRIRFDDCGKH
jgi:hypothetical protein